MPRKQNAARDLVIVESPAKATTIERHVGPGDHVTASCGYWRDLLTRRDGMVSDMES